MEALRRLGDLVGCLFGFHDERTQVGLHTIISGVVYPITMNAVCQTCGHVRRVL